MNTAIKPLASLPKIIQFLDTHWGESGEAECPHCGARGTVVHTFRVEGGGTRGAMSGCIKLFPVSPVANEDLKIRKKEADFARGKGYGPNRWDKEIKKAIEDFYAGVYGEPATLAVIRQQRSLAANWARAKFGGR